jgi:hypothetical protein
MFECSGASTIELCDTALAIAVNLVIGAFFFAKQGCEYTTTHKLEKTKIIMLKGVIFQLATKANLDHIDTDFSTNAEYVTITFVDQKNGIKMDTRTQSWTDDEYLFVRFDVSNLYWCLQVKSFPVMTIQAVLVTG